MLTLGEHHKFPQRSYTPDLPGGIVEPGESEQLAALRETHEECGIRLNEDGLQLAYSETAYYKKENKSVTKLLYLSHINETPAVTLSWEHSDYAWVDVNELQTIDLRPFFNRAIAYALNHELITLR